MYTYTYSFIYLSVHNYQYQPGVYVRYMILDSKFYGPYSKYMFVGLSGSQIGCNLQRAARWDAALGRCARDAGNLTSARFIPKTHPNAT